MRFIEKLLTIFKKEESNEEKIYQLKCDIEKILQVIKVGNRDYNMSSTIRHIDSIMKFCERIKKKYTEEDCKNIFQHLSEYIDYSNLIGDKENTVNRKLIDLKNYLNSI